MKHIYIHIVSNIPCGNQIWRAGKSSIHALTPEEIQHVDWGLPNIEKKHQNGKHAPQRYRFGLMKMNMQTHINVYYIYIINV